MLSRFFGFFLKVLVWQNKTLTILCRSPKGLEIVLVQGLETPELGLSRRKPFLIVGNEAFSPAAGIRKAYS